MIETINSEWLQMNIINTVAIALIGIFCVLVSVMLIYKYKQSTEWKQFLVNGIIYLGCLFVILMLLSGDFFPMKQLKEKKEKYNVEVIQPYLKENYTKKMKIEEFEIVGEKYTSTRGLVYPVAIKYKTEEGYDRQKRVTATIEKVEGLEHLEVIFVEATEKIGPYEVGGGFYELKTPE